MSLKSVLTKIAALSALSVATMAAQAATYTFALTGAYAATWQMSSSPVVDEYADGEGFVLYDVSGNFPGAVQGLSDIYFWNAGIGGGVQLDDYYGDTTLASTDGPQMYTGGEDAPTFVLGSYALTDFGGSGATYTLTISAVPEPATVAMLLAGLGVVGVGAARRRKTEDDAVAA